MLMLRKKQVINALHECRSKVKTLLTLLQWSYLAVKSKWCLFKYAFYRPTIVFNHFCQSRQKLCDCTADLMDFLCVSPASSDCTIQLVDVVEGLLST